MLLWCLGSDEDIVNVNKDSGNVPEYGVHQALKVLTSIFQSKRSSWKNEQAERRNDAGFTHVGVGDRNLVIAF